jgi:hypothetical protein
MPTLNIKPANCVCSAIVYSFSCHCLSYSYTVTCPSSVPHHRPAIVGVELHLKPCETCSARLEDVERAWRERRGICPYEKVETDEEDAQSSGLEGEEEQAVSIMTAH